MSHLSEMSRTPKSVFLCGVHGEGNRVLLSDDVDLSTFGTKDVLLMPGEEEENC